MVLISLSLNQSPKGCVATGQGNGKEDRHQEGNEDQDGKEKEDEEDEEDLPVCNTDRWFL